MIGPVPVVGYAPDLDPTTPGIFTSCNQVIPTVRGMASAPGPQLTTLSALGSAVRGAAVLRKQDDSTRFFAGMTSSISEASSSTWTDVTRASGGGIREYNVPSENRWRFAQFGSWSLAAAKNQILQASTAGRFGNVLSGGGTTAPSAGVIETVDQFVFLFDYNTGTDVPDGWYCSALGDHTDWTPAVSTQCANGRLYSAPGRIRGAKKFGSNIVAYKQRAMFLGVYEGPPLVWRWTQIPGNAGALSQEAIVDIGTADNPVHIFMGYDDFYVFDGSRPISIGSPLKETVFGEINRDYQSMTTSVHDRLNSLVYWFYPSSSNANPDRCVVYNYRSNRWGRADRTVEATCEYFPSGLTYADLGTIYTFYDSMPSRPYGEAFASSGTPLPAIFDTSHVLQTLTGNATNSGLTTFSFGDDSKYSLLRRVTPRFLTAPTRGDAFTSYRYLLGSNPPLSPGNNPFKTSPYVEGRFDLLSEARWHSVRMDLVGNWEMLALSADLEPGADE
jgi:hypothetical protein